MPKKRRGERSDGLIQVEVSLGYDADGKRKKKSFYGKTRKEANEKADAFRATLAAGIDLARQHITVREWTKEWMQTYKAGISASAQRSYNSALKVHIYPKIGHKAVKDIRHMDIQLVLNACAGMSKTVIGTVSTVLIQSFRQAARNRIIDHSPAVDLELPAGTSGTHRAIAEWEIDIIKQNWRAYHVGTWAMIMLYAGLRRGEMAALRWQDIDMESSVINVCHNVDFVNNNPVLGPTKTPAGVRSIPIPDCLMEVLNAIGPKRDDEYVCLSANNEPLTESALVRNWTTWLHVMELAANGKEPRLEQGRRKELPANRRIFKMRTHDLRHTFATMLYDAGVDEKTAQYLMGHTSGEMTRELYTHLSERTKKTSIDAWMEYSKGKSPTILPTIPTNTDGEISIDQND